MPPWFSVARLSLLDRGFVWALVHPRGGGELGRRWYLDGKLLDKRNTFTDTIAAAEHLVADGLRRPGTGSAIRGGSAGGLLVGACVTMRPDLFRGAVAEVPFVDVVTTMSDPTLPLTATEWEEWGDPRAEPYAVVHAQLLAVRQHASPADYPALYVTAGLNDPRVSYHEPAKWVARLRVGRRRTRPPAAAAHRDGRRPRRPERPLRGVARRGPHADVPARAPLLSRRRVGTRRSSRRAGADGDTIRPRCGRGGPRRAGFATTRRSTRTAGGGRRRADGRSPR